MGTEETDTPTKASKSSSTQEPPPSSPATVYPDWASFQAYYNTAGTPPIPPPAFFHSSMASNPQGHPPYMWGQHMMPPYGTPPPYVTMYPHGGLYAHPSMPPGSHPYSPYPMISPNGTGEASVAGTGRESDSKSGEGKKKTTLKRSKGSLGSLNMLTSKANEMGKSSGNQNGGVSQSGESVGEGSSGGSDANSHNDLKRSGKASADGGDQNGNTTCSVSSGATQTPSNQAMVNPNIVLAVPPNSVSPPTTNLNIGMDYWSGSTSSAVATTRAKLPTVSAGSGKVSSSLAGSHDVVPSDIWMQDERELKRQRRKQSNRESARRSRLRKQAEYDELAQRVEALKGENSSLRDELDHIREECEKLESENARLTESFANQDDSRASGVEDQAECTSQLTTNND